MKEKVSKVTFTQIVGHEKIPRLKRRSIRNFSEAESKFPLFSEEEFIRRILLRKRGIIQLFHERHFFDCGKFFSGINSFGANAVEVNTAGKMRRIKSDFIIAGFVELVVHDGSDFLP